VANLHDGAARLRAKPTGRLSHGGGVRFDLLDPTYALLDELVARAEASTEAGLERLKASLAAQITASGLEVPDFSGENAGH